MHMRCCCAILCATHFQTSPVSNMTGTDSLQYMLYNYSNYYIFIILACFEYKHMDEENGSMLFQ